MPCNCISDITYMPRKRVTLSGSKQLRSQDPAPARPYTQRRTMSKGREGGVQVGESLGTHQVMKGVSEGVKLTGNSYKTRFLSEHVAL